MSGILLKHLPALGPRVYLRVASRAETRRRGPDSVTWPGPGHRAPGTRRSLRPSVLHFPEQASASARARSCSCSAQVRAPRGFRDECCPGAEPPVGDGNEQEMEQGVPTISGQDI